jgi:alpha-tubulin suppressor-like RCC1 family protein
MIAVSCGSKHTLLLDEQGECYACGEGENGQLGLGVNRRELFPKKIAFE